MSAIFNYLDKRKREAKDKRRRPFDETELKMFVNNGKFSSGERYEKPNLDSELERMFKNGYPLLKDKKKFIQDMEEEQKKGNATYLQSCMELFNRIIKEQENDANKEVTGGKRKSRRVKKSKRKRTKKSKTKKRRSTRRK